MDFGPSKDEIVEDYRVSYINYYDVEKDTEKYNLITEDVIEMLKHIATVDDLDTVVLGDTLWDLTNKHLGLDFCILKTYPQPQCSNLCYKPNKRTFFT